MSTLTTTIISNYDKEDDILYLSLGKPTPSITNEIEDGILVRKDIKTKKVIGVTILDYKYRKNRKMKINIPKEFNLDAIKI